jgi:hypothetical protein
MNKKPKAVYTIREVGPDKKFWRQIGVAFENRDDSLSVVLDSLPLDGKLHIREQRAEDAGGKHAVPSEAARS